MKILRKDQLVHKQLINDKTKEHYSLSHVISNFFESKQFFVTHDKIHSNNKSSTLHRHSLIEELIYVSKGSVTLMYDNQKHIVQEGSFIFFDPKDLGLHCLANETNSEAETITFSIQRKNDVVIYEKNQLWVPSTLETKKLILRPIKINDAESIFSYAKNPLVSQYTLWEPHKTVEDSLEYINDYIFDYYSEGVPEPLGITLKENPEKVIGTVGCFWVSKKNQTMELAYAISDEYWGKGLVAEASNAVMDYCFKNYPVHRIQARCKIENKASARVMEKIGMAHEGTTKSSLFHRDRFWDMHHYAKVV